MLHKMPLVITVSRQLGSGGAFIGLKLASHFDALYLDREIINKTAHELGYEGTLESRDEKVSSIWQSFVSSSSYFDLGGVYIPPEQILPSDREIFKVEAEIISKIANEQSAVIIGRAGSYILRNHPHHVSVFLHADIDFRLKRIKELYKISDKEAKKLIESTDKSRNRYINELTGMNMPDAGNYHLSIDTGVLGLEGAEKIILEYIKERFGDQVKNG